MKPSTTAGRESKLSSYQEKAKNPANRFQSQLKEESSRNRSAPQRHREMMDHPNFHSPNAEYPVLIHDKQSKYYNHLMHHKMPSQDKDNSSTEPVQEEKEIDEDDEGNKFFKKVEIQHDGSEFNEKENTYAAKFRGRDMNYFAHGNRGSSVTLDSVSEAKNEDDPELKSSKLHHVEIIKDLKEFGKKNFSSFRKPSSTLDENGPIMEELEKVKKNQSNLSHSGSHSSLHHLKDSGIKVDEVDVKSKKTVDDSSDSDEDEKIDTIAEEDETAKNLDDNLEYQAAREKMHQEEKFVKKFIQSEEGSNGGTSGFGRTDSVRSTDLGDIRESLKEEEEENPSEE